MTAQDVVRYARGSRRRAALVEAAADVLLEQGLAALSHRAVAARAGLPLASTTYYFTSSDDLRDAALRHVAESWSARAAAVVDALPASVDRERACREIVGVLGIDAPAPQLLLVYERCLEAGRHPRLRPLVAAWNARLAGLVREVLLRAGLPAGAGDVELVLGLADGVAMSALAEGRPPDRAVRAALGRLLAVLPPQQRRSPAAGRRRAAPPAGR